MYVVRVDGNCAFGIDNEQLCRHSLTPRKSLYYNVVQVQDRLVKLLKSDLKILFEYNALRAGKFP